MHSKVTYILHHHKGHDNTRKGRDGSHACHGGGLLCFLCSFLLFLVYFRRRLLSLDMEGISSFLEKVPG